MRHAPTDLQSFRVTQLPNQSSAPVADWRALAEPEHLRDPPLQGSAAPAPGLSDIEDECIVNPFVAKPRDRDIGIPSLEMSAGPGSKELGRGGVISHKQVDPRTPRNCRSTSCPQLFDGFETIEARIAQSVNGGQGKWINCCFRHRSCSHPGCGSAPRVSFRARSASERGTNRSRGRASRKGGGRSGGFRTIVLFHRGGRANFAYGLAKRRRNDLVPNELRDYRLLATKWLTLDDEPLSAMLMDDDIVEMNCGEQTVQE